MLVGDRQTDVITTKSPQFHFHHQHITTFNHQAHFIAANTIRIKHLVMLGLMNFMQLSTSIVKQSSSHKMLNVKKILQCQSIFSTDEKLTIVNF